MKRTVFFISDSTGLTAENLGGSLLSQFQDVEFERVVVPYVDNIEAASAAVAEINEAAERDTVRPIVIDTIVNPEIRQMLDSSRGFVLDVLSTFLQPLAIELAATPSDSVGRAHSTDDNESYKNRIDAVNFALDNDDGAKLHKYHQAQVILVGVSRSGKTPTCLYLALQGGVFAANYPMTEEDLNSGAMPKALMAHKDRLFGLTIDPTTLSAIRNERRADSRYASMSQCEDEVRTTEMMFQRYNIPYINTSHISVEEIATRILLETGLRGHKQS